MANVQTRSDIAFQTSPSPLASSPAAGTVPDSPQTPGPTHPHPEPAPAAAAAADKSSQTQHQVAADVCVVGVGAVETHGPRVPHAAAAGASCHPNACSQVRD